MINNAWELAEEIGVDCIDLIAKAIYKGTDCGAWVALKPEGVKVGSIVEGSDAEVTRPLLAYPFDPKSFWELVQDVNDEACQLWDEANNE